MLSSVVWFREFIPAVEKGLEESMANGVSLLIPNGFDIKAKLYDGSYHDVDSSETAFKIAASAPLKKLRLHNQLSLNQ